MKIQQAPYVDNALTSLCRTPDCVEPSAPCDLYCESCLSDRERERQAISQLVSEKFPNGISWCYFLKLPSGNIQISRTKDRYRTRSRHKSMLKREPNYLCWFPARDFIPDLLREEFADHRVEGVIFKPVPVVEFACNANKGLFPTGLGGVYADLEQVFCST